MVKKRQERRKNHQGSIFQRKDGRWCAVLSVGFGSNGKRKRLYLYGDTRHDVEQKMLQTRPAFADGLAVDTTKLSLKEYLHRWLEYWYSVKFRQNTYINYGSLINKYLLPYLADSTLGRLTPIQLHTYFAALEKDGASPWRRLRVYLLLHKAFKDAVAWRLIYRSPMEGMVAPKVPPTYSMQVLDQEQLKQLIAAAKGNERFGALIILMATTGIRIGEGLGLFYDDINWDAGTVSIRRALVEIQHKQTLGEPKTESSKRTIELPAVTLSALRQHKERMTALGFNIPLVFPNHEGGFMSQPNFHTYHWTPLLLKAELPLIRLHDLRHSNATMLLQMGVPIKLVQERLGHKRAETTLETYAHVLPTMQRECVEKLDAIFSPDEKRAVAKGELEDFGQDDLAFLRILMNEANGTKPHVHPVRERKKKPAFNKSPSIVRRVKRPGRRK